MVTCALMAAMLAICAWISFPIGSAVFTLQSFGIALILLLFGGKWGTVCICLYLALGVVGLPVFSGFRGGIGTLLGATGGYILGFLVWALIYWLVTAIAGQKSKCFALITGLIGCYLFGSFWFYRLYARSLRAIFITCVLPYLLPDGGKLVLAWLLSKKLKNFVYR